MHAGHYYYCYLLGCQFFVPPLLVLVVVVVPAAADFFAPANFGHHLKQAFFILVCEREKNSWKKGEETKGSVLRYRLLLLLLYLHSCFLQLLAMVQKHLCLL